MAGSLRLPPGEVPCTQPSLESQHPHASVPDHDGDRDRFPRPGQAAVEQNIGHHLAGQENRGVTTRMRRAKQAAHEYAGLPYLI